MKDNGFHVVLFCFLFTVYICFLISDETVWQLVEHLLFYSLPFILSTVLLFNFTFLFFLCLFPICSPVFSLFSTILYINTTFYSKFGKTLNYYNKYIKHIYISMCVSAQLTSVIEVIHDMTKPRCGCEGAQHF